METQPVEPTAPVVVEKPQKKSKIWIIIGFVVLLGVIVLLFINNSNQSKKHQEEIVALQVQYQNDLNRLGRANVTIDSLFKVAYHLEKYRGLVEAGYTRDSSRIAIPHYVGDVVMLKVDSSRVVITDIVVGGSQFEYYVRYRVQHKDRTIEEVAPEMIF